MCLRLTKNSKFLITEKDITVWKAFEIKNGNLISPFKYYKYKLGEKYSLNSNLEVIWEDSVDEGFHAYISKKELITTHKWIDQSVIIPCKIPKGSQYVIGCFENYTEENNIVSNNIVLPKTFTYKDVTYYMNKEELKLKTARKRKENKYPLKYDDLVNGNYYVTTFPEQGIYIFKNGYKLWYSCNINHKVTTNDGDFTPSNGFKKFREATIEEINLLNND